MATYLPVLKAILPYLAPLMAVATPMFTKSSEKNESEQNIQEKQISELQAAVNRNVESVQTLAAQLQQAISAFDEREASDQKNFVVINDSLQDAVEQNKILKSALEKSIKDAQISKYISLAALGGTLFALATALLK